MSWDAWFTIGTLCLVMGFLVFSRIGPEVVLMGGLTLLLVSGILTPSEALTGFSNEGMITVGVLYFVVAGLSETGGIDLITKRVLGRPQSLTDAQVKLMLPVMGLSAFLNNTAVVAIMIQAVNGWARQSRLSVSKLLIPLSYAGIFGGTCSLIGTTTNLVVNGLIIGEAGLPSLGMFDIAWVGIPCAVAGFVVVLVLSPWLLPERKPVLSEFDDMKEYTVEMIVDEDSELVGKSINEAGLRHLPGTYLAEIDRGSYVIPAINPKRELKANDRLIFVGVVDSVIDLLKMRGLRPATNQIFKLDAPRSERIFVEAVVSSKCPLVGQTVREGRFRSAYDAVILAVARGSERITKSIGDVILRTGDTLLMEASPWFVRQQRNSRDFFLVSEVEGAGTVSHERAPIAMAILAGMVVVVAVGWLPMLKAAMIAGGLMVITGCISGTAATRTIDWQVLLVIGASFGIGHAMKSTGAAQAVAGTIISLGGDNPWLYLALIYVVTSVFTSLITNNAAAVLIFPIAAAAAQNLNVNLIPFAIAIMMAASASFATPIGYQTNLMVYGPGGYHFSDYLRMGLPLNVILGAIAVFLIPYFWPL